MAGPVMLPSAYRRRAQSFVKHEVLRAYLERAAMIILSKYPDFVFVDGFSGPWQNAREDLSDTSFGISLAQLRAARQAWADNERSREVRCVFVEKRRAAFDRLSAASVSEADVPITPLHGKLEDHIPRISKEVGNSFALFFLDPTGWNYDLRNLAPLLTHRPGEVLVNFMYEHFRRFIDDKRPEIRGSQDRALGGPEWRPKYSSLIEQGVSKETAVLEVFKAQLKSVGGYQHVASARVRHPLAEKTHFYLVYGTRHEKGLTEFRSVEKKVLSAEGSIRVQARDAALQEKTGQGTFLDVLGPPSEAVGSDPRLQDHEHVPVWLQRAVATRPVDYQPLMQAALERYSITEPEFKDQLVAANREGHIAFQGMPARAFKPSKGVVITSSKKAGQR